MSFNEIQQYLIDVTCKNDPSFIPHGSYCVEHFVDEIENSETNGGITVEIN